MAEQKSGKFLYVMIASVFLVVGSILYLFLVGLGGGGAKEAVNSRNVPTQFINKPAPKFKLQKLHDMQTVVTNEELMGKVWMLNAWATWCVACRQEHPTLLKMSRSGEIPVYGLDYKDVPSEARQFLAQHGDPYLFSLVDFQGDTGIDYGVYGVPESFIVDKQGIIRHKVVGPLNEAELYKCVLPIYRELNSTDVANVEKIAELRKKCTLI